MDNFEKEQTIEVIKTVVKARWFVGLAVFGQGVIMNLFLKTVVPLATTPILSLILLGNFVYNFGYWLYLRRLPEKVSDSGLKIIKALQVIVDQLSISSILYFSGTANKMLIVLYFISIMLASFLYRAKGTILATLSAGLMFSGVVLLEYFGFLIEIPPEIAAASYGRSLRGELEMVKGALIAFNLYLLGAMFFSAFLANLFKRREKDLIIQKNELTEKAQILTLQTQELVQAKGELQGALGKSDVARRAASLARDELEKANLELKKKIDELEKFYKVTVGREVRMAELKSQIKDLKETISKLEKELLKK